MSENSIKNEFKVMVVDKAETKEWILKKHYAKTMPSVMHTFGLLDKDEVLQGVCLYGTPANNHNNALGEHKMIELVRLVINEGHKRNTLSYFVSQTFKLLPRPLALISYADAGVNHHGYIYQATNWIYTGLGGGVDYYRDQFGKDIHSRIMSDLRKIYPDRTRPEIAKMKKWSDVKGTYKHRYFTFLGSKKEKKQMRKALLEKYNIEPYPKGKNKRYDASFTPDTQTRLF